MPFHSRFPPTKPQPRMVGWLFSFVLCVILCRKGLPLKPPKDGFRWVAEDIHWLVVISIGKTCGLFCQPNCLTEMPSHTWRNGPPLLMADRLVGWIDPGVPLKKSAIVIPAWLPFAATSATFPSQLTISMQDYKPTFQDKSVHEQFTVWWVQSLWCEAACYSNQRIGRMQWPWFLKPDVDRHGLAWSRIVLLLRCSKLQHRAVDFCFSGTKMRGNLEVHWKHSGTKFSTWFLVAIKLAVHPKSLESCQHQSISSWRCWAKAVTNSRERVVAISAFGNLLGMSPTAQRSVGMLMTHTFGWAFWRISVMFESRCAFVILCWPFVAHALGKNL